MEGHGFTVSRDRQSTNGSLEPYTLLQPSKGPTEPPLIHSVARFEEIVGQSGQCSLRLRSFRLSRHRDYGRREPDLKLSGVSGVDTS